MEFDVQAAIPHRPPFLLVDRVEEVTADSIRAFATLRADDELWSRVYAGHYPGNPITPGVLLCEMMFQAAACLVHEIGKTEPLSGVPVVTRIQNVKFKKIVPPGTEVEIRATLKERMANAFFMNGSILVAGKPALHGEFAVALA
jgi:3-hydroxyacyl-[acyl-carrier-protein] dehydratase